MTEIDRQLLKNYTNARYIVLIEQTPYLFRVGDKSEVLENLLISYQYDNAIFITAFNPRSQCLSPSANFQRNTLLKNQITQKGYQYLSAYSTDDKGLWSKEISWFVFGMKQAIASQLAEQFKQNAYLWIELGLPVKMLYRQNGVFT